LYDSAFDHRYICFNISNDCRKADRTFRRLLLADARHIEIAWPIGPDRGLGPVSLSDPTSISRG
jgi:hypothetical protein